MMRLDNCMSTEKDLIEPIAIVGIGCRFPGGSDNPKAFWDLMVQGRDGIVDVPKDRWSTDRFWDSDPDKPGKMYMKAGGFLQQKIDEFDALFFGMSPREAEFLDPQQRILLEVAWEAFEDAGIAVDRLAGSDTGVYVGGFMFDNMLTQLSPLNRDLIGTHTAVSLTLSILANRLSYVFDLRGPNIAIDTACSSSLVAVHQACQALRRGECSMALAGGVNIMFRPENPISMCKGGFLSKDGRCKSFDARADGYGRGEGAGIVVLKPLSVALEDRDDIYALIKGTGVNQDGKTNGITVPNPDAQESLIRRVCRDSGVDPRNIRYFEAHGTGTAVGDPTEARALGAVLGSDRDPDQPCIVGSVKANLGHLEAASGIAGIIKAALCLKQAQIPPLANLQTPNPDIPFQALGLRLPIGLEPMPEGEGSALVGVNSFGYGGTNAHAILEQAPPVAPTPEQDDPGPWILPISARSEGALKDLAASYRDLLLSDAGEHPGNICYSAAVRRGHYEMREAIVASSREDLAEKLEMLARDGQPLNSTVLDVEKSDIKPVYVLTGMGPQWWAMTRELYETNSVFTTTADEIDAIFKEMAGWSILDEMLAEESDSHMAETRIAQPANFVVQVGLNAIWNSWGIVPSAIVGHSVGEVAAAYIAGTLSLEDAVKVSYYRSQIQQQAAGLGTMLAVGTSEDKLTAILSEYTDQVSVAAVNGPSSTTLAGARECLEEIAKRMEIEGIFNRFLRVEMAFHSPYMDHLLPQLHKALKDLQPKIPELPLYSTVTGEEVTEAIHDADYWGRNVRRPVYFAKTIDALLEKGERLFLEIGPHPVLSASIRECAMSRKTNCLSVVSLRRGEAEVETLLKGLGDLYRAGCSIDWKCLYSDTHRFIKIPTYPWQRETYWHESLRSMNDRLGHEHSSILGYRLDGPDETFSQSLNVNYFPYLADHRVDGLMVLPGAVYVELGFALRAQYGLAQTGAIEDLRFDKALVIGASEEPEMRTVYEPSKREYTVYSRTTQDGQWLRHASGRLSALPIEEPQGLDRNEIRDRCKEHRDGSEHYRDMESRGLQYGTWFQGARELWRNLDEGEVLACIERKQAPLNSKGLETLDPPLLDACFQTMIALLDESDRRVYIPVSIRRVQCWRAPGSRIWCHGRRVGGANDTLSGELRIFDDEGNLLVQVQDMQVKALSRPEEDINNNLDNWFFEYTWMRNDLPPALPDRFFGSRWLCLLDDRGTGSRTVQALREANADVVTASAGEEFSVLADGNYRLNPDNPRDIKNLMEKIGAIPFDGILCFWALDAEQNSDPVGTQSISRLLGLIQSVTETFSKDHIPLYILTQGAQAVLPDESKSNLAQTPWVGLVRVAINEYYGQALRIIDLEPNQQCTELLLRELDANDGHEEIAFRNGERYVRHFDRKSGLEFAAESKQWQSISTREPGAKEVTISVRECVKCRKESENGLIDLLITGTITALGKDVGSLKHGQMVLAVYQGEPSQVLLVPETSVIPLNEDTGEVPADFASQVLPFVTAHYALEQLVPVENGCRVFIHHADSSYGRATIQVAQRLGAQVFASVRDALNAEDIRRYGPLHLVDGATPEFAENILRRTRGLGIELAFGEFTDEFANKIVDALAPMGRIVCVAPWNKLPETTWTSSYPLGIFWINPLDLWKHRREDFIDLVSKAQILIAQQRYSPIPVVRFDSDDVEQSADEPLKIEVDEASAPFFSAERAAPANLPLRADGTYLITGGFGGLGMEVAKWLVKHGVRHLVLAGRRGAASAEAKKFVDRLERQGTEVLCLAIDIGQEDQVARLFAETRASMPPLRGVFHSAGVLDDRPINAADPASFINVMSPKALGAWYLHQQSRTLDLDLFVLFSSVSALIGNPGQGAYVAANTILDTLAFQRRAQGLPAISINWGALSEVGMVVENNQVQDYFQRVGIGSFSPIQAMDLLAKILEWNPVQICVADINYSTWAQFNPAWAESPRYRHLLGTSGSQQTGTPSNQFVAELSELPPNERQGRVTEILLEIISGVMRIPIDKIDGRQSLINLGVDSLMAMEIQVAIDRKTGTKLSTLELMKGNSIEHLAEQVLTATEFVKNSPDPVESETQAAPKVPHDDIEAGSNILDALSEKELDKLSEDELDAIIEKLSKA